MRVAYENYLNALYYYTMSHHLEHQIDDDLKKLESLFSKIFKGKPNNFFQNPNISKETKRDFLYSLGKDAQLNLGIVNLLMTMQENNAMDMMRSFVPDYFRYVDETKGYIYVTIRYAVQLTDSMKKMLEDICRQKWGDKLRITYFNDPSLLLGVSIEADGAVLDLSANEILQNWETSVKLRK